MQTYFTSTSTYYIQRSMIQSLPGCYHDAIRGNVCYQSCTAHASDLLHVNHWQTASELEISNCNVCTDTAVLDLGQESTAVQEEVSPAFFFLPTTEQSCGTNTFMFGQACQIPCWLAILWGSDPVYLQPSYTEVTPIPAS